MPDNGLNLMFGWRLSRFNSYGSDFYFPDSEGSYWPSTSNSYYSDVAFCFDMQSSYCTQAGRDRYAGLTVRPVRDAVK